MVTTDQGLTGAGDGEPISGYIREREEELT